MLKVGNLAVERPPHERSARIAYLRVENFRALRRVELREIAPLTVLLGPNGSGKSTILDVFAFLSEAFEFGLRRAWDRRGRAKELKTRGCDGPVVIEIKYAERDYPSLTYHLAVDERNGSPVVAEEWLQWRRGSHGRPFRFLDYKDGQGRAVSGDMPDERDIGREIPLKSPDLIAVNALGQFADHPRVAALRDFVTGWRVSCLSIEKTRGETEAGPQERLSRNGDNLANVIQYLAERHPQRLEEIYEILRSRVPRIERVDTDSMPNGGILLTIKDAPFKAPVLAQFASDGTLKLLAYLVLLHDPSPPPFIGIEEPENFLHPRLLSSLAEEFRLAAERAQVLATTHSPFFLNGLNPDEVRVLHRGDDGYTVATTAADIPGVQAFLAEGAQLGHLWVEGHFGVGDPLTNNGAPPSRPPGRRG